MWETYPERATVTLALLLQSNDPTAPACAGCEDAERMAIASDPARYSPKRHVPRRPDIPSGRAIDPDRPKRAPISDAQSTKVPAAVITTNVDATIGGGRHKTNERRAAPAS